MLGRAGTAPKGLLSSALSLVAAAGRGSPCLALARGLGSPTSPGQPLDASGGGHGTSARARPLTMPSRSTSSSAGLGYGRAVCGKLQWLQWRQLHQMPAADSKRQEGGEEEAQHRAGMDSASAQRDVPEPLEDQVAKWGGLSKTTVAALHSMGIFNPTEIQRKVVPEILAGGDVAMLSETGSGKTLSYLLPMIEHMQRHEAALEGARPRPKRPRALVLLPTRELAVQTLAVAKKLSHVSQFSACGATGGGGKGRQTDLLHHGVDVVIGTPTRIVELAARKELFYGDVRHVVIDECDTIMSSGWGDDVEKILGAVRKASASARQTHERRVELLEKASAMSDAEKAQFLKRELTATPFGAGDTGEMQVTLVAATITAPVRAMLLEQCPGIRIVRSTGAHRAPVKVKQTFIECKPAEKLTLLVSHLTEALGKSNMGSVIVFCNTTASASFVHEQLKAKGVSHASFHGDLPQATRNEQLASFVRGDEYVLVSTDVMARGLDFANLNTVINFDFPNSSVDYIHRIGRTGRAGRGGTAVSFVQGYDQALARGIKYAMEEGSTIESVPTTKAVLHSLQQRNSRERREEEVRVERMLSRGKLSPYASAERKRKWLALRPLPRGGATALRKGSARQGADRGSKPLDGLEYRSTMPPKEPKRGPPRPRTTNPKHFTRSERNTPQGRWWDRDDPYKKNNIRKGGRLRRGKHKAR